MNDNIKLPPLPKGDIAADTCPVMWVHSDEQLQTYAREAIEADRQSRDCGQCVPLSTDGRSVFIDGVGEVPLYFDKQARGEPVAWQFYDDGREVEK